jgi:hypothetical protein
MGEFLAVVAFNRGGVDAILFAQVVAQNACSGAFLAVDVPHAGFCHIADAADVFRVARGTINP